MAHTTPAELSAFDHQKDIQEAAYYKWLNRGRTGGSPDTDWIEAELEFETNLYSDDDEVERSLLSSIPQRIKRALTPKNKRQSLTAKTTDKAAPAPSSIRNTSDQTAMATEQDET
jgi:hypothetical protein